MTTKDVAQAGVNIGPGKYKQSYLGAGDAGYAPVTSTHYLRAVGDVGAWVVLQFDGSPLATIQLPDFLSQVPKQVRFHITTNGAARNIACNGFFCADTI